MRTVIFSTDFANRKKGDEFTCDTMLASQLVNRDKVAKYKTKEIKSKK